MLHHWLKRLALSALLLLLPFVQVWSEQVPLRILHTNDWHGTFQPLPSVWLDASAPRPIGGALVLGGALQQRKADILKQGGRYLLVDAGDLFQGSMEVNMTKGAAMIDLYNQLGYAVTALGNHDFDYGPKALREAYQVARFPLVCANLEGPDRFWRNSVRLQVGPVKIGIFGVITPDLPAVSVKKNLSGVRLRNLAAVASAEAAALRRRGCDLIILLSHCGHAMDRLLAWWVPDVDVIIGGHSQDQISTPVISGKTLIMQTRGYGSHLGELNLWWSTDEKRVATWSYVSHLLDPEVFPTSLETYDAVRRHVELVQQKKAEKIADLPAPMSMGTDGSNSEIGKAMCRAIAERVGTGIACFHRNGIRNSFRAGLLTYGDLYQTLPFDHEIITGEIQGKDLILLADMSRPGVQPPLVFAGIEPADAGSVRGWRIAGGKIVDPEAWYPLAYNDFVAQGGDGFTAFARVRHPRETGVLIRDLFAEQLKTSFPARETLH